MKIGVLIPAYNESSQIKAVVQAIKSMGLPATVVDDGSSDGTRQQAEEGGAEVIQHEKNLGKGASLKTGFGHMLKKNYDAVLVMDGDGQHSPGDILKFIDLANEYSDAMLIGSRMADTRNMPLDRKVTNMFMSFIVSLICGQKIPDSQCGFRLIKKELLKNLNLESSRFEVESEILIKVSETGTRILSVPIETLYGGEESHIKPFRDTFRFIMFLIRLSFTKRTDEHG